MSNKQPLDTLAEKVRAAFADSVRRGLEGAALILEAKEKHFADTLAWLDWCQREFGLTRRHAFRLARIADVYRGCLAAGLDLSAACGTDLTKIEEIARISTVAEILRFLKKIPVAKLDREELREAVRQFLGKPGTEKQLTFLFYERLPDPRALFVGLDNPKCLAALDPAKEIDFVHAHLARLDKCQDRWDHKQVLKVAAALEDVARSIREDLKKRI